MPKQSPSKRIAQKSRKRLTSRAAIFDVDGTLIDSVDFHARAWQEALGQFGHRISFRRVRAQIGKGGDQLLPVFLTPTQIKAYGDQLTDCRRQIFTQKYRRKLKPFPGVRGLFVRLRAQGWKLAVASSAEKAELNYYLRLCGIRRFLDATTSADDARKSKPHPDVFNATVHKLRGISASHCVVIGDSPYDAIAARKARISSVGFLSGGFGRTKLKAAGCKGIYQGPADLLRRFDKSVFAPQAGDPKRKRQ